MEEREKGEVQQQQVIRWERFLPRRSLRVLLVENDDSTRHIVAALLRKCSYFVAAVADGVKAWEVLKEREYKIDLVLSEVDMPSLSGIDFLTKVTGCDLARNIPVIMMSSQDSVNVVFKCMLKGAVDFLVKPVRRNELRNLWQHVWRKHCSNSCINPAQRISDSPAKYLDASGNNVAINLDNSDADSVVKSKDNDEETGDTQSLGSKSEAGTTCGQKHEEPRATEINNSCKVLGKEARAETTANGFVQEHASSDNYCGIDESYRSSHGKENLSVNEEIGGNFVSSRSFCSVPSAGSKQIIDFVVTVTNEHDCAALENDACCNEKDIARDSLPSQDSSLKRPGPNSFSEQGFQERHILKHSTASAFSRYGKGICNSDQKSGASPATLCISPKESTSRFLPLATTDKEEVASFTAWRPAPSAGHETNILRSHQVTSASSNDGGNIKTHPPREASSASHNGYPREEHGGNPSSNENIHNRVTFHPGQLELMPFPFPAGRISIQSSYAGYGAILQPLLYSEPSSSGPTAVQATKDVIPSDHLSHQGNHPSYDLSSQQNHILYHLESERKDHMVDREHREPEAFMCTEVEQMDQHNHCNVDLFYGGEGNRSGDITDYHGNLATSQGNENGLLNLNSNSLDHTRSHREAALMKFRLKRKDRCFEKKVRYHSRKMLAEQRPRIKGQFVRQSTVKPNIITTEDDD